jgi:hypothetical protein
MGTIADPILAKTPKENGGAGSESDLGELPPSENPSITSPAIAAIRNNMKTLCTLLPARAPKQLMPVNTSSTVAAIALSFQATPVSARK